VADAVREESPACPAAVIDGFSRRLVGFSITARMCTGPVAGALENAARTRAGLNGAVCRWAARHRTRRRHRANGPARPGL